MNLLKLSMVTASISMLASGSVYAKTNMNAQFFGKEKKVIEDSFQLQNTREGTRTLSSGLMNILCDSAKCEVSMSTEWANFDDYAYDVESYDEYGNLWRGILFHHQLNSSSRARGLYKSMTNKSKVRNNLKQVRILTPSKSLSISCEMQNVVLGDQCLISLTEWN